MNDERKGVASLLGAVGHGLPFSIKLRSCWIVAPAGSDVTGACSARIACSRRARIWYLRFDDCACPASVSKNDDEGDRRSRDGNTADADERRAEKTEAGGAAENAQDWADATCDTGSRAEPDEPAVLRSALPDVRGGSIHATDLWSFEPR
jgi:hypothetical protein